MTISIIAAMADNRAIGYKGKLPWRQKDDLQYFKNKTLHHHTIMGRKTYESIPTPLPDRTCIVITRQKNLKLKKAIVVNTLKQALELSKKEKEVFITGGAEIYKLALPFTDKVYLTHIHAKPKGDTFFPEFDKKTWKLVKCDKHKKDDENLYDYDFCVYEKAK